MAFLDQFLDGALPTPGEWTPQQETEAATERLQREMTIVHCAMMMKRRLGGDASPQELSADKKIAKMVFNRLLTIYETWGGDKEGALDAVLAPGEEEKAEGAQINWNEFWEAKKGFLKAQVRTMAGNAVANNDRKNGNRFANRYTNEYNSIGDVLDPVSGAERSHKYEEI
jgi:hypothetical protein